MKLTDREIATQFPRSSEELHGRSHLSTDGVTAYSYGVAIARKLPRKRAVVSLLRYSNTTAKHIGMVHGSLEQAGFKVKVIKLRKPCTKCKTINGVVYVKEARIEPKDAKCTWCGKVNT